MVRFADILAALCPHPPPLLPLQAASEGPRATEQFAAIAAAFVSSLAATCRSQEMAASFLAELADRQHEAYGRKDT